MVRRLPAPSLRVQWLLTAGLLLAAAAAAPLLVLPDRLEARDRAELERRAIELGHAFGAATEAALDFDDRPRAVEVLSGLARIGGAISGRLLGPEGEELARWGTPVGDASPGLPAAPAVRVVADRVVASVPVTARSGRRGAVEVALDLGELHRDRAEARAIVGATAGVVFLAGLLAAALLYSALSRPLRRLSELAGRIAGGDEGAARHLDPSGAGEAGQVASALGSVVERLVSQRAMLAAQHEASDDGLLTLGLDGRVLTYNRRLRELWGLTPQDLDGRTWTALLGRLGPRLASPPPAWLAVPAPSTPAGLPRIEPLSLADGGTVELHAAAVRAPHGAVIGLCLAFRDVTALREAERRSVRLQGELEARVAERTAELAARLEELRRTQEQLVQADRAVAVGRLAAGVAHEINNPLSYVVANLDFVKEGLRRPAGQDAPRPPPTELLAAVEDASAGAARVARIVKDLKVFSRGGEEQRVATRLEDALEASLGMAAHELRLRAEVVREYRPAPPVLADPVRLSQVFLNLLINAAQAIEPGAADRNRVSVTVGQDERGWPFVEVTDSGCGMPPDVLGRIFDPFFTTKPQGQGTGLGLSISRGIVNGLGGRVEARSEPGRGATFRVTLPPAAQPGPEAAGARPAARLSGRLLVVDDEPAVADAVRRLVDGEVETETTTCPREALRRLVSGEPFDFVLCDLMMPVMTGMELLEELERLAPAVARRLVFMTGGATTEAAGAFLARHQGRCLDKPFDADQLRRVLHAVSPG